MTQPSLSSVKAVLNSILTSSKSNMTILQLLNDYRDFEGHDLPFEDLQYNTVYDLLKDMSDILTIPCNPSMNSYVRIIVNDKTSHIRELILRQKSKKPKARSKRNALKKSYNASNMNGNNRYKLHENNQYESNVGKYYDYSTRENDYKARGYDYVNYNSSRSLNPKGYVTKNLQRSVEDLCRKSQSTSIKSLKACLINHEDYKILNVFNIEDAINMLKYFIYLDKGGVHLKDSPHEIFSKKGNATIHLPSIINEDEEMSINGVTDYEDEDSNDYDDYYMESIKNSNYDNHSESSSSNFHSRSSNSLIAQKEKTNPCYVSSVSSTESVYNSFENKFELQTNKGKLSMSSDSYIAEKKSTSQLIKSSISTPESMYNSSKYQFELHASRDNPSNSSDLFVERKENTNKLNTSSISTPESMYNSFEYKFESQTNGDEQSSCGNHDYKKKIVSIINQSSKHLTVNQVLKIFKIKYGYDFPFQKLACRTCMDYFRLYPDIFKLDNPYSTNSIIKLEEKKIQIIEQKFSNEIPHNTLRSQLICASILNNDCDFNKDNEEKIRLTHEKLKAELQESNHQPLQNNFNALSDQSTNVLEKYDSDMILKSMKEKMRFLLSKHKNGILCNEFMDVYANEFGCGFVYNEYGFRSMIDMAYQLPSVFYVEECNEQNQYIFFNAEKRNEVESDLSDPSEFYKNIPKTVLCNLSNFFKKYSAGITFDELKTLYCSEYGRCYEPIKYGYSSEFHMFKSLNKMVKIVDHKLYTADPYAYLYFNKNNEPEDQDEKAIPVLPNSDMLLTFIGSNICHGKFKFSEFRLRNKNTLGVYVAEIYSPGYFYIQMASDVDNLRCFMTELQSFYDANEEKYSVLPEFITVGLPCTSRFEESQLWHRAQVVKINDDRNVTVLYVDYGSVEVIPKSEVKLLDLRFGALPIQSLPCTLFENNHTYSRKINDMFAEMVDSDTQLDATIKHSISIDDTQRHVIDLFAFSEHNRIDVKQLIIDELKILSIESQESVRKMILRAKCHDQKIIDEDEEFVEEVKDESEDSYYDDDEDFNEDYDEEVK